MPEAQGTLLRHCLPCSGQALELPEHYVPSAYREWDVHLYDWQTQCSVQALQGGEGLRVSLKRLMPSVGVRACPLLGLEAQKLPSWLAVKLWCWALRLGMLL